jgi:hypothetical protein
MLTDGYNTEGVLLADVAVTTLPAAVTVEEKPEFHVKSARAHMPGPQQGIE